MSRPSETACTRETFTDDSACLNNFNANEQKALLLYFNVLELEALGGADYTDELGPDGTLASQSACLATLTPYQKQLSALLVNQGNASDAGAVVPATQALLAAAIACLRNQPAAMLDAMLLNVLCQLGRHAAFPQVDL